MNVWVTRNVEFDCTDVKLSFSKNGINFTLVPEYPQAMNATFPKGRFDSSPSNGSFWFQWDLEEKFIEFTVAKYGDGQGGSLFIQVPLDDEDCARLKKSLIVWEDAFKK